MSKVLLCKEGNGEPHVFWNRTVFQEFSIPVDINVPKPLPPEAERTLRDIENGEYEYLKKFKQKALF